MSMAATLGKAHDQSENATIRKQAEKLFARDVHRASKVKACIRVSPELPKFTRQMLKVRKCQVSAAMLDAQRRENGECRARKWLDQSSVNG